MKIRKIIYIFFITLGFSNIQNANTLPEDFYMKETYKNFLRTDMGESYSIEKKVNNNFSSIIEVYNKKNNKIFEKYENKYINPLVESSYNDYYQLTKKYEYNNGILIRTSYLIGKSENCFVKCDDEVFYNNNKIYKIKKYPSCLGVFDIEKRILKYEDLYVKNNCK